jgi:hypothetical protein
MVTFRQAGRPEVRFGANALFRSLQMLLRWEETFGSIHRSPGFAGLRGQAGQSLGTLAKVDFLGRSVPFFFSFATRASVHPTCFHLLDRPRHLFR